ncbi:MAG: nicotinate (nicotinamide) nucleotide adenylyltransferase [Bacteroidales bacterium]
MCQKKKTGLYFGSFNPIHVGHLIIANYMQQFTDLDEVWFVVSPQNPLKNKKSLLADIHRLALVRIATEDHTHLKVSDIEYKLPKPSYTIDTLTFLDEKYPDRSFKLICGGDNLESFQKWKNYEKILKYYELYVYKRPGSSCQEYENHPSVHLFDAPQMEISASFIREGLAEKKDMSFFLTPKVCSYIKEMHFYEKK